jgi:hypothetical protein
MFNGFRYRACLFALLFASLMLPLTSCKNTGLSRVEIAPTSVSLTVGQYVQFTAWGYYGSSKQNVMPNKDITSEATFGWDTSVLEQVTTTMAPGCSVPVGSICKGLFLAVSAGSTEVSATDSGFGGTVGGNATVTVTAASGSGGGTTPTEPVVSLAIVPTTQTALAVNQTAQFIAIGTTATGTTVDLTNQSATIGSSTVSAAVWKSSNPSVASINAATGIATALSAGTTTISAVATNPDSTVVMATATYNVNIAASSGSEPLVSMSIVPSSQTLTGVGQTANLVAIGTTGTGTTVNSTGTATWKSSNPAVATINSATGVATSTGAGTTVITAIASNPDGTVVTGTATITVTIPTTSSAEPLASLAIIPASQTLTSAGQQVGLIAIGTTSSGTTVNLTDTATWQSSVPSVASINATTGVATAVGNGTTAITAIASNPDGTVVIGTGTLTVTASASSQVTSLAIIPGSQTITMPLTTPTSPTTSFVAIGTISSTGLQVNETNSASWTSSNTAVATIGAATGLVTPVGQGTTTITAQYNNPSTSTAPASVVVATATLTVNGVESEPLLSVAVLPSSQSISYPGQTSQLTAIGTFSSAPVTQNLTSSTTYPVTWTSSNTSVATVCNATATSTVPTLCPTTPGLVTAVGQGTAAITAIASNSDGSVVTGVATITVANGVAEQVTALTIIPGSLALSATGQPGQFVALGTNGTTGLQEDVTASPQLAWSSSVPSIATIESYGSANPGQASGVSAGATDITAKWTNTDASVVTATASVAVTTTAAAEPLLSITVLPSSVTDLNLEGTAQFLAYGTFSTAPTTLEITNGFTHVGFAGCTAALYAAGTCATVPVSWVSTAPFDFPIDSAGTAGANGGLATANASGTADIYAIATNPDSTLVYSPISTFNCPYAAPTYGTITTTLANGTTTTTTDYSNLLNAGTCNALTIANSLLSTLTVFNASTTSTGLNQSDWLITAPSATGTPDVIHCGGTTEQATVGGSVCEATYPNGTVVTLTAPPETGVNFGGWSSNCTAQGTVTAAGPNSCTVVVGGGCVLNQNTGTYTCSNSSNITVGAIFN